MEWTVKLHEEFEAEYEQFSEEVQDELLAEARYLIMFGPETSRPHVDRLNGSSFANMKELRFEAEDGEWRVAFAFDPKREAILLVAGDKTGISQKKFYKGLIDKADGRYSRHLEKLKVGDKADKAEKGKQR
jgi:hypothetical protein